MVDIVRVLADYGDSRKARKYWNKLSQRLREEGSEVVTNCHRLKLRAEDGKLRETFDMTPNEYKKLKGLKRENLRDHMNDLELIFSMLGERVSTEITRGKDAQGYDECEDAAKQGGEVAGNARKDAEKRIGKPVSTKDNYKELSERKRKELESQ